MVTPRLRWRPWRSNTLSNIQRLAPSVDLPHIFRTAFRFRLFAVAALFLTLRCMAAGTPAGDESTKIPLRENWRMQSSCEVKAGGAEISTPGFRADAWHKGSVPTTVIAALVADGTYPDPYFGMNLKSFPGMDYSSKSFFANQTMPANSPFRCAWWFRTVFSLPAQFNQPMTWLHFDGINYRANVWLNGEKIANAQDIAGMMRVFEFEVSKRLAGGKPNADR